MKHLWEEQFTKSIMGMSFLKRLYFAWRLIRKDFDASNTSI
jgi:hypothetical protein